jgi:RNA polymerase sigma-70 factor (ECF subfamily)
MKKYTDLDDTKLVELAKDGEYKAFEELVQRYETKIYGHMLRLLGNREDAEDILQETFLNAFRALKGFRGDSSFSTWIYRIATNNALMKLRKMKRKYTEFREELPPAELLKGASVDHSFESPPEALMEKEMLEALDKAVEKLPEKYRAVFLLRDVEEFSTQRTAEILDLTEAAVKSRLHRARIFLKESLSDFLGEEPGT